MRLTDSKYYRLLSGEIVLYFLEKLVVNLGMARSRIMLYSFKESNGKVTLDYTLTRWLVDYDNHHCETLKIDLPTGLITLKKAEYLNTGKVYFNGRVFFIVATKYLSKKYVLRVLLEFACMRIETRLTIYKKLLAA